jgi:FkbM family methyltransferase
MPNRFSSWLKKKILGSENNLFSVNDPFLVMQNVLGGVQVSGIVDAGASTGRISRIFRRRFPEAAVYAFEPNPLYRRTLEDHAARDPRFHPVYSALTDREGTVELLVTRSPGNTSLLTPDRNLREIDPRGSQILERVTVEALTLDRWAQRLDVGIQVLKLDIQGGESRALQGAAEVLRGTVCAVYTEILFNSLYEGGALFGQIDLCLRERGFALYDIYKPKYHANRCLMWANALYLDHRKLALPA